MTALSKKSVTREMSLGFLALVMVALPAPFVFKRAATQRIEVVPIAEP